MAKIRMGSYSDTTPNSQLNQPSMQLGIAPTGRKIKLTVPVAVNYAVYLSEKSTLLVGITREFAFKPIAKGDLTVNTYGKIYNGEFSPRSSYWGLNVQYQYSLARLSGNDLEKRRGRRSLVDSTTYRKAVFVEFMGNGINLTANYDMRLNRQRSDGLGFRAGIGSGSFYLTQAPLDAYRYITLPLAVNYIVGKKRSGFEGGLGLTTQYAAEQISDESKFAFDTFFNLGYRFLPVNNGLMFRAMWTPSFQGSYGFYAAQYGLSLGYSFR